MKLTKYLLGFALTAIGSAAIVSCTNELSDPSLNKDGALKLVRTPEVYAWSGNQTLNSSNLTDVYTVTTASTTAKATRTFTEINFEEIRTSNLNKDEEEAIIDQYLPEQNENLNESIQRNFLFKADKDLTFEIYPVYCQTSSPKTVGIFYYDNEGNYGEINKVFDGITQWQGRYEDGPWVWHPELNASIQEPGKFIGKKISIPKGYIFGFFWNGNDNNGETTYYSIESWNNNAFATTGGGQKIEPEKFSKLHGVTFELNDKTYLGLEDWTDFDFQDLVFTCPENLTEVPIESIPPKGENWTDDTFPGGDDEGDNGEENCPNAGQPGYDADGCGHQHSDPNHCDTCPEGEGCNTPVVTPSCPNAGQPGYDADGCGHQHSDPNHCDTCPEGEGCNVTPTQPNPNPGNGGNTDTTPSDYPAKHDNEVEVNFEIVDSHKDEQGNPKYEIDGTSIEDLATKLSIHVRHATNIDIKIPVPTRYIIDSDDLYIFNEHYGVENEYHGTYGNDYITNSKQALTYYLGDHKEYQVNLYVEFIGQGQMESPFNEGYIYIHTEGITEPVIEWCMAHNSDGINFEIWTYYSTNKDQAADLSRGTLKDYLDHSIIRFLNSNPDYYINAFGYDYKDGTNGQQHKENDPINPDDCTVTPDLSVYPDKITTEHLNGTQYNDIYKKSGVEADEAHSQH